MSTKTKLPQPPQNWEELVALKEYLTDCPVAFLRFQKSQEKYTGEMNSVSREEGLDKIKVKMNGQEVAIVENIYPHDYVLQNLPNVSHYCLWSTRGPLTESEINEVVDPQFSPKKWMSMTRRVGYVSIPEIWHSHIYVNSR